MYRSNSAQDVVYVDFTNTSNAVFGESSSSDPTCLATLTKNARILVGEELPLASQPVDGSTDIQPAGQRT